MRLNYSVLLSTLAALGVLSSNGNYSVQLMAKLKPEKLGTEHWNAAVDAMIGKSTAYVGTELLKHYAFLCI